MNFLKKVKAITEGWGNYIFSSDVIEKIAFDRAKECASCEKAVKSKWLVAIIGDEQLKEIEGYKCDCCGCPLSALTRNMTKSCPHPEKQRWQ